MFRRDVWRRAVKSLLDYLDKSEHYRKHYGDDYQRIMRPSVCNGVQGISGVLSGIYRSIMDRECSDMPLLEERFVQEIYNRTRSFFPVTAENVMEVLSEVQYKLDLMHAEIDFCLRNKGEV